MAIAVAGHWFDEGVVRQGIVNEFRILLGRDAAAVVGMVLESAARPRSGWLFGVIGAAALLVGASSFFSQLQDALNRVWEVAPRDGWMGFVWLLRKRLLSFGLVVATGFLLLISLLLSAALHALVHLASARWRIDERILTVSDGLVSILLVLVIFLLIYKILPDVELTLREVAMGSLITAALFVLGRSVISLYLGRNTLASAYGAASSLVVFLLWVYYSTLILLFGAEFTRVYSHRIRSGPPPPVPGAVPAPEGGCAPGASQA